MAAETSARLRASLIRGPTFHKPFRPQAPQDIYGEITTASPCLPLRYTASLVPHHNCAAHKFPHELDFRAPCNVIHPPSGHTCQAAAANGEPDAGSDSGDPRLLDELGLSSTAYERTEIGSGVPEGTLPALPPRDCTTLSSPGAAACVIGSRGACSGSWGACCCVISGSGGSCVTCGGGGFADGSCHRAGSWRGAAATLWSLRKQTMRTCIGIPAAL